MLSASVRTATAIRAIALLVLAAFLLPASRAQSGDPGADAYKQMQQMQNDPRYQQMMKDPQVRAAMEAGMKNAKANTGPNIVGGETRVGLPKRDTVRLAAVSRVAPTQAQLAAYIPKVHAALMNRLPADQRSAVQEFIAQVKADGPGSLEAAGSIL